MGQVCEQVLVSCPEGCGEMILRGRVSPLQREQINNLASLHHSCMDTIID